MPQAAVWLPAAIGAAAQIGGAVVGSRAASGAQKAQLNANQEALNYERQRQAEEQQRRDKAAASYRQAWLAWYERNGEEGVRRYGVPVGITLPGKSSTPPTTTGGATRLPGSSVEPVPNPAAPQASAGSTHQPWRMGGPAPAGGGGTLGDLGMAPQAAPQAAPPAPMGAPAPPQAQASTQGATLGSLGGWEDWRQYGVGA